MKEFGTAGSFYPIERKIRSVIEVVFTFGGK